jgi:hypothetical protein
MTSILLPPQQRLLVLPQKISHLVTVMPFGCKPLRPLIPSIYAYSFDVVGLERKVSSFETSVKIWEEDKRMSAALFAEGYNIPFRLDLQSFSKGDEIILVVENIAGGPCQISCAWLVEDERRS